MKLDFYSIKAIFLKLLVLLFSINCYSQEICNNGIDDDSDGLIDLNDSDCLCNNSKETPSLIPNCSFENRDVCPHNVSEIVYATTWNRGTTGGVEYIDKCGFFPDMIRRQGLDNFPDGSSIAGMAITSRDPYARGRAYLGNYLKSNLIINQEYQLTFNMATITNYLKQDIDLSVINDLGPINMTLYGIVKKPYFPIGTSGTPESYDNNWTIIGSVTYTPSNKWKELTINFNATENYSAIVFGFPPVLPLKYTLYNNDPNYPYFLFDNFRLNTPSAFGLNIVQSGSLCDNNLILQAKPEQTLSNEAVYQWYKEGIALVNQVSDILEISKNGFSTGNYSVLINDGSHCYLSPTLNVNNTVKIPEVKVSALSCSIDYGTITVLTKAMEYSFDNGVKWQTSPIKSNLMIGSYDVKTKSFNFCVSAAVTVEVKKAPLLNESAYTVIQPKTCSEKGTITITQPDAISMSLDGGITFKKTLTLTDLDQGFYQLVIRTSEGCVSERETVHIESFFLEEPKLTLKQPTCSSSASLKVDTVSDFYSFDNGITWTENPEIFNLNEGVYHIFMKNKSGCISTSSSVVVLPTPTILPLPMVTVVSPSSCISNDGSIMVRDKADLYSFDNGESWSPSPIMNNLLPGNYFVKIKNALTDCPSEANEVNLKTGSKLIAASPQTFCAKQNATLKDIVINGINLKWYDKNSGGNQLIESTLLIQGATYYVTQTFGDCESLNRLPVTINIVSVLPVFDYEMSLCDINNDGVEIVNLQDYNTNLTANVSEYTFEYFSTFDGANTNLEDKKILNFNNYPLQIGDNVIYAKAILNKECYRIVELKIALLSTENLKQLLYVICENNNIVINAETGFDDYQWSTNEKTPSIVVSKAGQYSLTTIKKGANLNCTATTNFEVVNSYKPIISKIITSEWTDNENTIEVLILNTNEKSNYEYSLDNINYQTSNKFWGLKSGTYKVYVKDKYNCGIVNQNIYLLMYPKFFTPNGDGFNDLWYINNNQNGVNIKLKIFDRYGRFLKEITSGNPGWDGKYNGEDLPSDDYWFVILIDNQIIKGHFSLKR